MNVEKIKSRLKNDANLNAEDYAADVLLLQRLGDREAYPMPPTKAVAEGVREKLPGLKKSLLLMLSDGEAKTIDKVMVLKEAEDLVAAAYWCFEKTIADNLLSDIEAVFSEFREENRDLHEVAKRIRSEYVVGPENPASRLWGIFIRPDVQAAEQTA